ncbi:MAG: DNA-3-methyladenine glycosylase I [Pseudomonadota bacterium]
MQSFAKIYEQAIAINGSEINLKQTLPVSRSAAEIRKLDDAYCLAQMSIRIFQAGLNQKMIDNKWPAFEEVFHGFDIDVVRMMSDEALESLMHEKRIVRHWGKISSVRHNAQVIHELNEDSDGFIEWLANWPPSNIVSLWFELKNRFKQLGGSSGPFFLRRVKKDTFLLTDDVVRALGRWGAIDYIPKNKTQLIKVQEVMNQWQQECDLPYCQMSMILARSIE